MESILKAALVNLALHASDESGRDEPGLHKPDLSPPDLWEPDRCKDIAQPNMGQFIISCILLAWLLVSYVPQYYRIIARRSAEGLSTLYILLGSASGVCAVANILVLPASQVDLGCCRKNDSFACIAGLLGMVQVILGVGCFWGVLFLYVYYARDEFDATLQHDRASLSNPRRTMRRARKAWLVLLLVLAWAFLILIVSAIIMHRFPWFAQQWADVLGIIVAALACVQWLPQLWTTWHLGHLGSLSVTAVAISTPSTWIFAFSLIARVGVAGWSAWIVYVLVGTMQLILISTAIFFAVRDSRQGRPGKNTVETGIQGNAWLDGPQDDFVDYSGSRTVRDHSDEDIAPDEQTPLVRNEAR